MVRRPPRSTRTDTLFPYATLFRSIAFLIWPIEDLDVVAHTHDELPPGHLHLAEGHPEGRAAHAFVIDELHPHWPIRRSEEHTSELQSLMRISYAVFCLNQKITHNKVSTHHQTPQHNTYLPNI